MLKKIISLAALSAFSLSLITACGPTGPGAQVPGTGQNLESDGKLIQGSVTGSKLNANSMVALYGAFLNVSGNKIDAQNNTINNDIVLAVAPVTTGKYSFNLPKAPSKANVAANLRMYIFNDANGNKTFDEGELKSKEAQVRWVVGLGYQSARDAEGNEILLNDFKDFNFVIE